MDHRCGWLRHGGSSRSGPARGALRSTDRRSAVDAGCGAGVAHVPIAGRHHRVRRARRVAPGVPYVPRVRLHLRQCLLLPSARRDRRVARDGGPPGRRAHARAIGRTQLPALVGDRMRGPAGRCPNCSAPIQFRWSSAVQTVCESCRSVVVRHDVDLDAIGEVSDLPPDSSPIQLGTKGRFDNQSFTVIGRIAYEYDGGGWNEWHLAFANGASGWLSDAQAEYAVSALVTPPRPL